LGLSWLALIGAYGKGLAIQVNIDYVDDGIALKVKMISVQLQ
jgi:hypothetical protein